ncbi:hypothetical protein [Kitasatospora sp. MMS16-BH015]|uniref:hypothetical protein n=1 Tax=Kitasatospora sp. MMS16-BH015 TaxID=2018025 RepID=UPI000CF27CA3|nr:hypothetical protein [Kitasatospora sp. MMS16-BH015]
MPEVSAVRAGVVRGGVPVRMAEESVSEVPVVVSVEYLATSSTLMAIEGEPDTVPWLAGGGVRVLVEGTAGRMVVLRGLRVVVDSRRVPRPARETGTRWSSMAVRDFTVDLDAERPVLVARGADLPFTVHGTDPAVFSIAPHSAFEAAWHLELDWTSQGRSGTVVVDWDGRPFEFLPEPPDS